MNDASTSSAPGTPPPPATLREFARLAGVSPATASLALNHDGRVACKTRERIEALAREVGYKTHPLASAMARQRVSGTKSQVYGAPVVWLAAWEDIHPAVRGSEPRAALGHASRIGFQLRVRGVRDHQEIAAVLREEYARGAMGAIIGKLPYEEQVIQLPIWKHFSVISVGRFGWEHTFHNVRPSIFGPCRQALTLLWERGYRRIGCVLYTHHPPHPDDHARFGAVLDFQHRITPEHRVPILEIDDAPNREQFCNWVKTHRPDCILSFFHAHGEILREMGYRLPEDLGFFTLHLNDRVKLDCSGFRQNRQLIGKTALRKLSELLRHGERGRPDSPETTLIEPTLMEGITC